MKSFEDLGFYCIEHVPPAVLDSASPRSSEPACAGRCRGARRSQRRAFGDAARGARSASRGRTARGCSFSTPTTTLLVRRFSETRRRHPLRDDGLAARSDRRRTARARAVARARRRRHRHDEPHATARSKSTSRRPSLARPSGAPRRDLRRVRLQVRPAARSRSALRRALPAQSALRPGRSRRLTGDDPAVARLHRR